jgi:D-tagatose-1,6-bisphosphate aldolase subunit GatZ/KbaZ
MQSISAFVRKMIDMREREGRELTLLAVCPNSSAVLDAAVVAAARNRAPMLFAATLNQVDHNRGYTGWTPAEFVSLMQQHARKIGWPDGYLYPCLDHGGPWLKDTHVLDGLSYNETMAQVKLSIRACLQAGYRLLHIDPTVDRELPEGEMVPLQTVVSRTLELIAYAESEREQLGIGEIAYEVGTEEVHGGLVDIHRFSGFLQSLREGLDAMNLSHAWPCFVVAQVGTDLHTTTFDPQAARQLYEIVAPLGSLVKGHYTDWVENPEAYPRTGMGGANVGPEFTAKEYLTLQEFCAEEQSLVSVHPAMESSQFMQILERAVFESGRWLKWLQPGERGLSFDELRPERKAWLVQTGARYVWTDPEVSQARRRLYENLTHEMDDPHAYVVDRIAESIEAYITAFNLTNTIHIFEEDS